MTRVERLLTAPLSELRDDIRQISTDALVLLVDYAARKGSLDQERQRALAGELRARGIVEGCLDTGSLISA